MTGEVSVAGGMRRLPSPATPATGFRRDHQLRGLAILSLPAQPAHGRGDAGRARHRRQPQEACGSGRSRSARISPTGSGAELPCAGDKWHLDEVAIKIAGQKHWVWCAVDLDGIGACRKFLALTACQAWRSTLSPPVRRGPMILRAIVETAEVSVQGRLQVPLSRP